MLPYDHIEHLKTDWALILLAIAAVFLAWFIVSVLILKAKKIILKWLGYDLYEEIEVDHNDLLKYVREQKEQLDVERSYDNGGF